MIPLSIDEPNVLRRTLEELESKLIIVATPISPVDKLPTDADLATTIARVNEVIEGFNAVVVVLNATNTSDRP